MRSSGALKASTRPLLDCVHAPCRAGSRSSRWPSPLPALGLGVLRSAATSCPGSTRAPSSSRPILPAEASLAQVDSANHRAEDLLREFPEVEDVVRRTGRAERTEDPMPHTVSDVLVVLKPERSRSLEELEEAMREKMGKVPGLSALFTTPLGMRIDEGLGGTPADISVRIFGPDLDELSRLAAKCAGDHGRHPRHGRPACRRADAGCRSCASSWTGEACARVGLTPGRWSARCAWAWWGRSSRRSGSGSGGSTSSCGCRTTAGGDLGLDPHHAHRRATTARKVHPGPGRAASRKPSGPAVVRREAGSRRIAVEASVAGRDLGSAAAEVRERLAKRARSFPPATSSTSAAGSRTRRGRPARS